jgi:octaprenyl-diphosphate synthase
MVWKVLKSTFQNDKPLFNAIRQATVFPEALGESFFDYYTEDVSVHIKKHKGEIRTDILAISENLIDITRTDWPFLSRLFSARQITPGIPFRPSVFLLLSGYHAEVDRDAIIKIGTAIELGFAASLCHDSVIEDERLNGNPNWGNMTSVLLGDFLLSKSFEVITSLEPKFANIISEALVVSNHGKVQLKNLVEKKSGSISIKEYIDHSYVKNRHSFELFFHLGALLRKANSKEMQELKEFGKHFGAAYFIIEDTIQCLEKMRSSGNSIANIFYAGDEHFGLLQALSDKTSNINYNITRCFGAAKIEMEKALSKINTLSNEALKYSLQNLSKFVIKKAKTPF